MLRLALTIALASLGGCATGHSGAEAGWPASPGGLDAFEGYVFGRMSAANDTPVSQHPVAFERPATMGDAADSRTGQFYLFRENGQTPFYFLEAVMEANFREALSGVDGRVKVRLHARAKRISLGGVPGTKASYDNVHLLVEFFEFLKPK